MSQEFKNYDKVYAEYRGRGLEYCGVKLQGTLDLIERTCNYWPYRDRFTEDYSQTSIRNAVYFALKASEWQKFRVSLKGLNTKQKIFCLVWWWDIYVDGESIATNNQYDIIRVNNYLGALKRAGLLDSNLNVCK